MGLLSLHPVQALGLGAIQSQSALGQPLRLSIPLSAEMNDDLGCVRVAAGDDSLPAPSNMRSVLVQKNQAQLLEISTRQNINEPAITLRVMVGCTATVTRQYVVLLDPPQSTELATAPAAVDMLTNPAAGRSARTNSSVASAAAVKASAAVRRSLRRSRSGPRHAPVSSVAEPTGALRSARPNQGIPLKRVQSATVLTQADRVVLSTQVEGSPLRLSTGLSDVAAAKPGPEQLNQLRQGQTQMAAILNDQDPVALMAAREAVLADRIQRLTEQATGLQKQIDVLTLRNQTLQQSTLPSWVVWLLGVLALLALTLGTWFAWRYRVLRQTLAGQPWWTAGYEPPSETSISPEHESRTEQHAPAVSTLPSRPKQSPAADKPQPVARTTGNSIRARLDAQALSPLGNSTAATDIGGLSRGALAMELTEHEGFDASRSSFDRLVASQVIESDRLVMKAARSGQDTTSSQTPSQLPPKQSGSPDSADPVDFMLDITSGGLTRPVNQALDLTLATNIEMPPVEPVQPDQFQAATESFFMGMTTEPGRRDEAPTAPSQTNCDAAASSIPKTNPHFLQDEDELNAIATELLQPLKLDQFSLHVRLVQYTSLLEQIEEMIHRNDSMHTIELLRRYVLHEPNMPTLLWLLLLDQYRKTRKKAVYESFTLHFTRHFGRPAPRWDNTLADLTPQLTLAEMPEIDDNIKVLWGTQAGLELIEKLVCSADQSDAIIFNASLQRELLQLAPMYPMDKMTKI